MAERKTGFWTRTKHVFYVHTWEYYDWVDEQDRPWDKRQCHGCLEQQLKAGPAGWTQLEEALGLRDRFDQRAHGEGVTFDQPDRPARGTTPLEEILGPERGEQTAAEAETETGAPPVAEPERTGPPSIEERLAEARAAEERRRQRERNQGSGAPSWSSSWMVRGVAIFFGIQFLIAIISTIAR